MDEKLEWLRSTMTMMLEPPPDDDIATWMERSIYLPSGTSEPGMYRSNRAPYQKKILEEMSPQSSVRRITLAFGAQMGKTLMEQGAMLYYIKAFPKPQAFAFSNDKELKEFVKTKFDPLMQANPDIKATLGIGTKLTGNTVDEKLYPGGFLRFVPANSESSMRSYSVAVLVMDEIDTYPIDVAGNGDPMTQLLKRTNTFASESKVIASSTPANHESHILAELEKSTYNVYKVKCPHCGEFITLEWEYMKWTEEEANGQKTCKDVWMECPECGGRIENEDKDEMLSPENGAHWEATRPEADPSHQGYFLPTFYAPVGWVSWKNLVQEYLSALSQKEQAKRIAAVTAFYNTVLVRQYKVKSETPIASELYEEAKDSPWQRGHIPNWVLVLTSGADVQKNRIEVTLTGWGKRGKNIDVDHFIIPIGAGEDIQDTECSAWQDYAEFTHQTWKRDDGYIMTPLAHAIDGGYIFDTVRTFNIKYGTSTTFVTRGLNRKPKEGELIGTIRESKKEGMGLFMEIPVDNIKQNVYRAMMVKDEDAYEHTVFCNDWDKEYFDQLCAEEYVWVRESKRFMWVKMRDRNEALDCKTYNFAMYYYLRLHSFSDKDWEDMAVMQSAEAMPQKKRPRRGTVSKGIEI